MSMLETCDRFYTEPPEALADVLTTLTSLITGIRHVLVHPDLQLDQKIVAVSALVEAAAPPPSGRTGEGKEDRAGETAAFPPGAGTAVTRSPALFSPGTGTASR
jgi:hypothetical protein